MDRRRSLQIGPDHLLRLGQLTAQLQGVAQGRPRGKTLGRLGGQTAAATAPFPCQQQLECAAVGHAARRAQLPRMLAAAAPRAGPLLLCGGSSDSTAAVHPPSGATAAAARLQQWSTAVGIEADEADVRRLSKCRGHGLGGASRDSCEEAVAHGVRGQREQWPAAWQEVRRAGSEPPTAAAPPRHRTPQQQQRCCCRTPVIIQ